MFALVLGTLLAIDTSNSTATFSVSHVFVEHVTGTVPVVAGTIDLPKGASVPTRVEATLDPTRLHTDEPDRDAALKGPDWFDTTHFSQWLFTSTRIEPSARGFVMGGILTIHGVSQLEEIQVVVSGPQDHPVYHATARIDRHAFGMAKTRLDPVIGGVVDVTLEVRVK